MGRLAVYRQHLGSGVIAGLVPGIQPSEIAGACGGMDPGDKHRDDIGVAWLTIATYSRVYTMMERYVMGSLVNSSGPCGAELSNMRASPGRNG